MQIEKVERELCTGMEVEASTIVGVGDGKTSKKKKGWQSGYFHSVRPFLNHTLAKLLLNERFNRFGNDMRMFVHVCIR